MGESCGGDASLIPHLASRRRVLDPFAVPQLRFTLTTTPASAPATPSPVFPPPPPDRRAARSRRGSDRRDAWRGISSLPARTAWRAGAVSCAATAARPPRASGPARTNQWRRRAPAGRRLEERDAQGVEIEARVERSALRLLGGEVLRRADGHVHAGRDHVARHRARDPKSESTARPSAWIRMLSGFRSRW